MPTGDFDYEIIYSKRKTLAIQINRELKIIVRAPLRTSKLRIARFVRENAAWIEKHLESGRQKAEALGDVIFLTEAEIKHLKDTALRVIPPIAKHYADKLGVSYGRITIRSQVTRWGSCSAKGNLNFNCLLMLCPKDAVEYVIIHELCHRKYMNHSALFWSEVKKHCPDYKIQKNWFDDNGAALIRRLRKND